MAVLHERVCDCDGSSSSRLMHQMLQLKPTRLQQHVPRRFQATKPKAAVAIQAQAGRRAVHQSKSEDGLEIRKMVEPGGLRAQSFRTRAPTEQLLPILRASIIPHAHPRDDGKSVQQSLPGTRNSKCPGKQF